MMNSYKLREIITKMTDTSNRMKALQEYKEKVKNGEIEATVSLNPLQKAEQNPTSLRFAVNAMCYQCMGAVGNESKQDIRNCTSTKCPLHKLRPYQK